MLISVGTYERNLYGVSAKWTAESSSSKDEEPQRLSLEPEYIFPAHAGCIKAMATGGRFLASGSTDELIHLYDTRRRKELGTLAQHSGTITSLVFHGTVNMLSASDDGEICVWRSKDWECLATLKGHKGSVNAVTIHPSGKLALSVGVDKSLRVWNLETGKQASTSRLRQEGIAVVWSAESETTPKQYAVLMDRAVEVYDVNTASLAARIEPAKGLTRLHCLCAAAVPSDDGKSDSAQSILLVGSEDKMLRVYDARDGKELSATKVHDSRLKGIAVSSIPLPPSSDSKQDASRGTMQVVTTISSDGFIKIWDLHHLLKSSTETVQPIGAYDTKKSRLTAVAVTTAH
ncbi:WD40 repeat-like protein [Ramicandelaber brevisporus]|nr:WD40 repeat-like protein [Ramicandelaber brevisporus]